MWVIDRFINTSSIIYAQYNPSKKVEWATFASTPKSFLTNTWYTIRVEVKGDTLTTYVDNKLVISKTLPSPIINTEGGIGYYMGGGDKFYFDDIKVWSLNETPQTVSASPTITTTGQTSIPNACNENQLAFATTRDGDEEIYIMDSDGTGLTNITRSAGNDGHPTWSPNGEKLAFHSDRSGDYEIYTMNADGSGITRLTNSSNWDGQPSYSPDGKRIAFESQRTGTFEVFTMKADGTEVLNLTKGLTGGYPEWSPDGTQIVFHSSGQHGNTEIYTMNSDGSNITRLTNTNSENWMPVWSPDGKRIIFSSNRIGKWEL